jgi:hypothetical protein
MQRIGFEYGRMADMACLDADIAETCTDWEETGGYSKVNAGSKGGAQGGEVGMLDPTTGGRNSPMKSSQRASNPLFCLQRQLLQQQAQLEQQRAMLDSINASILLILSRMPPDSQALEERLPSAVPASGLVMFASDLTQADAKIGEKGESRRKHHNTEHGNGILATLCFPTGWFPNSQPEHEQPGQKESVGSD